MQKFIRLKQKAKVKVNRKLDQKVVVKIKIVIIVNY